MYDTRVWGMGDKLQVKAWTTNGQKNEWWLYIMAAEHGRLEFFFYTTIVTYTTAVVRHRWLYIVWSAMDNSMTMVAAMESGDR